MRSWEKKDITDILIKHHEELRASIPEDDEEQVKPLWTEVDDDCIVIENFLEEGFGIWWDGLKFRHPTVSGKDMVSSKTTEPDDWSYKKVDKLRK